LKILVSGAYVLLFPVATERYCLHYVSSYE
jgi:hypothetical protein